MKAAVQEVEIGDRRRHVVVESDDSEAEGIGTGLRLRSGRHGGVIGGALSYFRVYKEQRQRGARSEEDGGVMLT